MARRDKSSRSSKGRKGRRKHHRRTRSRDSYTSSSSSTTSCSCLDCGYRSETSTSSSSSYGRRHSRPSSNTSSGKSKNSRSHSSRRAAAVQPAVAVREETPLVPGGDNSMGRQPKIAMILLLGREEREFRLTEAQILFDSPNDLTSTYYAQDPSDPDSSLAKTYRMPDRDAGVFEIIYRYMNRESVLPLRKSACPKHLSYEQTERKLAEEAKFYRLTKLLKALPSREETQACYGETVDMEQHPARQSSVVSRDYAQQQQHQQQQIQYQQQVLPPLHQQQMQQQQQTSQIQTYPSSEDSMPAAGYAGPVPGYAQPGPSTPQLQPIQPPYQVSMQQAPQLYSPAPHLPTTPMLHSSAPASHPAPFPPSETSSSRSRKTSSSHRSRQSSSTVKPAPEEIPNLTAFLYRGEAAPRRGEAPFPILGYPDDSPLPHLLIKATNAEIKFSAFRNAENEDLFELRYSIRILDEPATRPLAYRARDSTIKAVDSHLRLNGVLGTIEARDVPIRIHHSQGSTSTSRSLSSTSKKEDESYITSDLEELLVHLSTQGFVKWPRVWQDSFDNITPPSSSHQRVSLPCAEVLFALEFPEEAALISAEVGGRGFSLDTEDEDELRVRNYRVSIHAVKCDTRKLRRLKEMDELGQAVQDGMMLKTPSSASARRLRNAAENGLPTTPRRVASDSGMPSSPSRMRSDSGYGSERRASYDVASEVGSSVSRRPPRLDGGSSASLAPPRSHHGQQASSSGSTLSVPQYQYVKRPGHAQQPSYSSQRSDVTARSTSTSAAPHSEYYQYPQTPSTSRTYPTTPTQPAIQAVDSRPPPPSRGHYHPLAQNVPNTPQTWSNPQNPSYHQPPMTPLPARRPPPPSSPYYGSDPGGTTTPRMERRSESRLAVPLSGPGAGYAYTAGGRPRSGSSQSGMSVRTTASEEIKRRAMERWGE